MKCCTGTLRFSNRTHTSNCGSEQHICRSDFRCKVSAMHWRLLSIDLHRKRITLLNWDSFKVMIKSEEMAICMQTLHKLKKKLNSCVNYLLPIILSALILSFKYLVRSTSSLEFWFSFNIMTDYIYICMYVWHMLFHYTSFECTGIVTWMTYLLFGRFLDEV